MKRLVVGCGNAYYGDAGTRCCGLRRSELPASPQRFLVASAGVILHSGSLLPRFERKTLPMRVRPIAMAPAGWAFPETRGRRVGFVLLLLPLLAADRGVALVYF